MPTEARFGAARRVDVTAFVKGSGVAAGGSRTLLVHGPLRHPWLGDIPRTTCRSRSCRSTRRRHRHPGSGRIQYH